MSPTCPRSSSALQRALPLLLVLVLIAAPFGWSGAAAAPEEADMEDEVGAPADVLVLPGGERLPCRVVSERAGWLEVELHGRVFRFERARLAGLERGGEPAADPLLLGAVIGWARDLVSEHPAIRRGADAALGTLAPVDLPVLRAALREVPEAAVAALAERIAALEARALRTGEDVAVQRALEAIGLSTERAPLVAARVRAYLFRVARGGSPEGALEELRAALAPLLDTDDLGTVVRTLTDNAER